MTGFRVAPLTGLPEVRAGDDLAALLAPALAGLGPAGPKAILVVAQKIVSKAEGRMVDLTTVTPSPRARELSVLTGKDPRVVELVLAESSEVLRTRPNVLIARHRQGYVMANAGIDQSNVPGADTVLLLPEDCDRSAAGLRRALAARGHDLAVVISDSFGRPWRQGTVNIALGAAGLPSLIDHRGEPDREGRAMEVTMVAFADAVAAAAGLAMGEGAEGCPAALLTGLTWAAPENDAAALLRPADQDLFR